MRWRKSIIGKTLFFKSAGCFPASPHQSSSTWNTQFHQNWVQTLQGLPLLAQSRVMLTFLSHQMLTAELLWQKTHRQRSAGLCITQHHHKTLELIIVPIPLGSSQTPGQRESSTRPTLFWALKRPRRYRLPCKEEQRSYIGSSFLEDKGIAVPTTSLQFFILCCIITVLSLAWD